MQFMESNASFIFSSIHSLICSANILQLFNICAKLGAGNPVITDRNLQSITEETVIGVHGNSLRCGKLTGLGDRVLRAIRWSGCRR